MQCEYYKHGCVPSVYMHVDSAWGYGVENSQQKCSHVVYCSESKIVFSGLWYISGIASE